MLDAVFYHAAVGGHVLNKLPHLFEIGWCGLLIFRIHRVYMYDVECARGKNAGAVH